METLVLVRTREPLPPSRLRPRLPRDLETICLKCLEKAPQARYPMPRPWPTTCGGTWPPCRSVPGRRPAWERAIKWVRRHPALRGRRGGAGCHGRPHLRW